jgi:hypothetical protein
MISEKQATPTAGRTDAKQADLDQLYINTTRTLSMDAVQEANHGHAGTPMAEQLART